jgi:biotin carboxylase
MNHRLAIIGASYLQLPLVKKAKAMGLEVHCFSWEEGAVCSAFADYFHPISIVKKEIILDVCRQASISGVLSIASDIAVVTVNYVAEKMRLIGNPDSYSRIVTNKYLMRKCLQKCGLPSPKFKLITNSNLLDAIDYNYPLIIKPTDRSGSRGVTKVNKPNEYESAALRACNESFSGECIVEEFVNGHEISVEAISWEGKHYILAFTDKVTTGEPFYVEIQHHQPAVLSYEIQGQAREIVARALDALNIRYGASHSELIVTDSNEIRIIEIGARMGGDFIGSDLVALSTGYDFLKGVIDASLGKFEVPNISELNHAGIYFLCRQTANLECYVKMKGKFSEIIRAEMTDNVLRPVECSADRSGYFIYKSKSKFKV